MKAALSYPMVVAALLLCASEGVRSQAPVGFGGDLYRWRERLP